jgi:hypothetical protein
MITRLLNPTDEWLHLRRLLWPETSDTELDNVTSQAVHEALGFVETERVVYYRKLLD